MGVALMMGSAAVKTSIVAPTFDAQFYSKSFGGYATAPTDSSTCPHNNSKGDGALRMRQTVLNNTNGALTVD